MKRRVCLISLLPLTVEGGGERYSLSTAASIVAAGDHCRLFSPLRVEGTQRRIDERLDSTFLELRPEPPHTTMRQGSFRTVLDALTAVDVAVVHQYCAADYTIDVIANVASDQSLVLTNLGSEEMAAVFEAVYQASPNHLFAEISDFAAARSRKYGGRVAGITGGIWRRSLDRHWPTDQAPGGVCAVGRMLPHKGFEVTIDAIAEGMELAIVGPSGANVAYDRMLEERAAGKAVEFLGHVDDSAKAATIRRCRTLVASSCTRLYDGTEIPQAELLGLVIFEALAHFALPITSDLPPFLEVMEKLGLAGHVYRQRDSGQLRQMLGDVRHLDREVLAGTVESARERMGLAFAWDDYWERVLVRLDER